MISLRRISPTGWPIRCRKSKANSMTVPEIRISSANSQPLRSEGQYVLYWMIASRRVRYNFSLQYAVQIANELRKPLIVFEPLRIRYRWASDRIHRFIIEGMQDNQAALEKEPVSYFPYVEPEPGVGSGLLSTLAENACITITDDYPCFFLPRMIRAVAGKLPCRLELVDGNGIVPLRLPDRTFTVAHSYRRWVQKNILDCLCDVPVADPFNGVDLPKATLPNEAIEKTWPRADFEALLERDGISRLPIDHSVPASEMIVGGSAQAEARLDAFLKAGIEQYGDDRNHPDESATTGLSPYLHFGHIGAHEVVERLLDHEDWAPDQLSKPNGKNHGFWNTSESTEAFLDQILTWREMGFNLSFREPETYDRFESLPDWARKTLREHRSDERPYRYSLEQFEAAETHDELWNAAQRELVLTGAMHNYMRMLWGKKILHWTESPQEALRIMIHLNNKYALDGRDPNSYSGIFWVLGRYDRAWGPKRPIFGSVRYMTSDSARRKLRLSKYLAKYGDIGG